MPEELKAIPRTRRGVLTADFVVACQRVAAARPRRVIDHILKYGVITTEDLATTYGYEHPPRAARDVKENGIPLKSYRVRSPTTGRSITAYTFDTNAKIRANRIGGRGQFKKEFRDELLAKQGAVDALTKHPADASTLQIDHRIPYEVGGDEGEDVEDYMLLDPSSQRRKSWACEACENWKVLRDSDICRRCYWAFPDKFTHVAMRPERRVDISWSDAEVEQYEKLVREAVELGVTVAQLIKDRLLEK